MTIKRRLFFSNIRIIIITFAVILLLGRMAITLFYKTGKLDPEAISIFIEAYRQNMEIIWALGIILFIIIISVINNFHTYLMTKKIIKPLETISKGVDQIYNNNFTFRIDYHNDDEFRTVCNAFNEMAAKLEASAIQRKKDEVNRKELIAGISHDLRTPLTSIKGSLEGIDTGIASTPEMKKKYLEFMKNKTAELEHIIEQLFIFSKLDMDEFPFAMSHVDISQVIIDIIEESIPEYSDRGLSIEFFQIPINLYVNVDAQIFRNVIINILENSVKYKTKEQGHIKIRVMRENNSVLIYLEDDGPGVQSDMLPKLFDAFYRTDPARSKQGSGLGLAISAKIIEHMGGSIYAQLSKSGGLAIVINLPLLREEK